jgi:hypothetical protein
MKLMGNTVGSRLYDDIDNSFYAYMAGFLDGDGCIAIRVEKSKTCKLGMRVRVRISFTQHRERRVVLDYLYERINSGVIAEYNHNNMAEYVIRDQEVVLILLEKIKPYVVVKSLHLQLAQELLIVKKEGYSKDSLEKMLNLSRKIGSLNNYPKRT